jgi:hypothetical protein
MLMSVASSFDSLVAELSAEERASLLERIKASMSVSAEPLYSEAGAQPPEKPASERLEELGIIARFILFLRSVFTGKSREQILVDNELREIGRAHV